MGPILVPPREYDFPFPGQTFIHSMSSYDLRNKWGGTAPSPGKQIESFSYRIDPSTCVLVLPNDVSPAYLEGLRRHENAHCNGWPEDHPGATLP